MPDKQFNKKEDPPKGKEDRSIAHDMDHNGEKKYPRPTEEDTQQDNQPEFNERTSGQKDEEAI